jgi:hypothetical protein
MRRSTLWLALLAAIGATACGETAPDTPTAPNFTGGGVHSGCNFSTIQQAVNAVFTGSTENNVRTLVNQMKNQRGSGNQAGANVTGYKVLDTLSVKYVQGTAANASLLAYQVLLCTSTGAAGLSAQTFVAAFGPTGAFGIVGQNGTDAHTVASHDNFWVLHPPAGQTWAGISSAEPLVLYGSPIGLTEAQFTADPPVHSANIFNWLSHPSGVSFSPKVVVGNCEPGTAPPGVSGYVQHNAVSGSSSSPPAEILDFVQPDCSSALFSVAPVSLSQRIWRFFAPATAYATYFLPRSGGQKSSLSPDAVIDPGSVNLAFESALNKDGHTVGMPLRGKNGQPLSVATSSAGGTAFKQTTVFAWLEATANNGSFVQMCNNWAYSGADGRVTFTNAFLNKAGGYRVTVRTVGTAVDESAPAAPPVPPGLQPSTGLFNVKNGTVPVGPPNPCSGVNAFKAGDDLPPSNLGPPPISAP